MAKQKNQRIYSTPEHLQMLAEEQRLYIGREYSLDLNEGCLTIFARPQKRHVKKKEQHERNKREEKFARRAV
jgi:hypothetical protein